MSTDRAVEAACSKFAEFGIDFRCPWDSSLDDLERERFEALRAALTAAFPELVAEVDLKLQTMVRELLAEDSNEFTKGKITGLGYARQFLAALQLERGSR